MAGPFDDLTGDLKPTGTPSRAGGIASFDDLTADLQPPKPVERPSVARQAVGDLGRSINATQGMGYGLVAAGADALGNEETRDRFLAKRQETEEWSKANPPLIGSYKNIQNAGDLGRYAVEAVAGNAVPLAITAPLGVAGGLAARGLGMAPGIGAAAGAGAASTALETGEIYGDIHDKTGRHEPGTALAFGAAAGALDAVTPGLVLGRILGTQAAGEIAKGLARRVGVGAAEGFLAESLTEAAQTAIEKAAVSKVDPSRPYWTPELTEDLINSFLQGGMMGAAFGGAGGMKAPRQAEQPKPAAQPVAAIEPDSPIWPGQQPGPRGEPPAVVPSPVWPPQPSPTLPYNAPNPTGPDMPGPSPIWPGAQPAPVVPPAGPSPVWAPDNPMWPGGPVPEAPVAPAAAPPAPVEPVPVAQPLAATGVIPAVPLKPAEAVTSSGRRVPVQYALVEADSLVPSHQDNLTPNPDYPERFQPRDRTRGATELQITDMLGPKFRPELLGESSDAANGAPLATPEGVVISGNMRSMALRRAYDQGLPAADAYRSYLASQGYPVQGMKAPVLVRTVNGAPKELEQIAVEANRPAQQAMSATETAMADAKRIPDGVLGLYRGGEIDAAGNRDFVRAFLREVVGQNEQNTVADKDGVLSQDGQRRIRAALLARAYGDADVVAALVESTDSGIKGIGNALLTAAPAWAKMRAAAATGEIEPAMDVTPNLLDAVKTVARARRDGRNVAEYVQQTDMLAAPMPPETEALLRAFFRNKDYSAPRGQDKIAADLLGYVAEAEKTQPDADMFGQRADPLQILQAIGSRANVVETPQAGLFGRPPQGDGSAGQGAGEVGAGGGQPAADAIGAQVAGVEPGPAGPDAAGPAATPGVDSASAAPAVTQPAEGAGTAGNTGGRRGVVGPKALRQQRSPIAEGPVGGDLTARNTATPDATDRRLAAMLQLGAELRRRAPDAQVKVFDELVAADGSQQESGRGVTGAYLDGIIHVALSSRSPISTLAHEVIHHLRATGRFSPAEWSALSKRAADSWRERFGIDETYADQPEAMKIEEAVAQAADALERGQLQEPVGIRRILAKVQDFLGTLRSALNRLGIRTFDDWLARTQGGDSILRMARSGEIGMRQADTAWSREIAETTGDQVDPEAIAAARGPLYQRVTRVAGTAEQEAIMAKIGVQERAEGPGWSERWAAMKAGWQDRAKQGMFDQFHAIRRLEEGQWGQLRDATVSAYKAARLTPNLSAVMHTVLRHGPLQYTGGEFTVRPGFEGGFTSIFDDIAKRGLLPLWKAWAIANRSRRLIGEGRENLLSQDEIAALLPLEQEHPEFRQALDRWQAFNGAMLDMAQAAGMIDPQARKLWERNDYVPFYRVMEDGAQGPKGKRGLAGQKSGIRTLFGGKEAINDLVENMVMNMTHLVDASFKNVASERTIKLGQMAGMTEEVGRDWKSAHVSAGQAATALRNVGVDVSRMTEPQRDEWLKLFTMVPPTDPDVVSVMEAGKPKYHRVNDPMLLQSLGAMQWSGFDSVILELAGRAKNLLTRAVTSFPDFMIANFIRDGLASWVVTRGETNPLRAAAGFARSLSGNHPSLIAMAAAGGDVTGHYNARPEDVRAELDRALNPNVSTVRRLWDAWQGVGQASERANRLALYDRLKAKGASNAEAAYQALDLMDYQMRGSAPIVRALTQVVPFMNARLQGMYRLGRGAAAHPGAFFMRGSVLTALSLGLLAANWDDPEYEAQTDTQKDSYLFLRINKDTAIKIPQPFEVGALFSTLPVRAARAYLDRDDMKKFGKRIGSILLDQMALDPTPQLVKPILEQYANKIGFTQAPIVGNDLERLRPQEQIGPNTSGLARGLAAILPDVLPDPLRSPVRIDAAVRGYLGTAGTALLGASTGVYDALTGRVSPTKRLEETPVLGRFLVDAGNAPLATVYQQDFHELRRQVEQAAMSFKRLRDLGDRQGAANLVAEKGKEIALAPMFRQYEHSLSEINKALRMVREGQGMPGVSTADEKRAVIDRLLAQRAAISRAGVMAARAAGVF